MVAGKEQTPIFTIFAFPIVDAAIGKYSGICVRLVGPNLFTGSCIQGDVGIILGQYIHNSIHNHRVERIAIIVPGGITPGNFQLAHIGTINLLQCGILGRIGGTAIIAPGVVVLRICRSAARQQ